jgi:hypothetical protein
LIVAAKSAPIYLRQCRTAEGDGMSNKINPCGCGGKAKIHRYSNCILICVSCSKCGCRTNDFVEELDAIKTWNTAHPDITAKTFNFATALLLMKWYAPDSIFVCCRSLVTNTLWTVCGDCFCRGVIDNDGYVVGICQDGNNPTLAELNGQWERVDA